MLLVDELGGLLIDLDYAVNMIKKKGETKGPRGIRTVSLSKLPSNAYSPYVGNTAIHGNQNSS